VKGSVIAGTQKIGKVHPFVTNKCPETLRRHTRAPNQQFMLCRGALTLRVTLDGLVPRHASVIFGVLNRFGVPKAPNDPEHP